MAKLQERTKDRVSPLYSINIPAEKIKTLKWTKGEALFISTMKLQGKTALVIITEEDALQIKNANN